MVFDTRGERSLIHNEWASRRTMFASVSPERVKLFLATEVLRERAAKVARREYP
jgi:hypothetical protein